MFLLLLSRIPQSLVLLLKPLLELQFAVAHVGGEAVVGLFKLGAALYGGSLELKECSSPKLRRKPELHKCFAEKLWVYVDSCG